MTLYVLHERRLRLLHPRGTGLRERGPSLELFPDGLAAHHAVDRHEQRTALGGSRPLRRTLRRTGDATQPWQECLRGAVSEGFSLVVYEGGSVDELEACAQSRDVAALYALSEGEFVSYILGAPAFVNQSFRDLFVDGVPPMTPLVARSEGQPGGR